jgi:hypothetical protein
MNMFKNQFLRGVVGVLMGMLSVAANAAATTATSEISHPGPAITAYVKRGDDKLPIFLVDHLHKGDKLVVTTNKTEKGDGSWLLVLALVSPLSNKVDAQKFDLTEQKGEASIDITADDQVPVMVLAPQVRTLFGLHTSFSESATLIVEAIKSDPQRFVDLQKIDQIDHAITLLMSALDATIQSQKPEQAVEAAKALAAKFGVKFVDSACFKDNVVNTRCVAVNIVTSKDMIVPASDDLWSSSGPNAAAAKIPTDLFASLKIVTEASTYLVNKYGDNYDFAPSSGHRQDGDGIQLMTSARFKSGDVKTAYAYVPSWFVGKQPEVMVASKLPACLPKGEFGANVKGVLPLENYWHDWEMVLLEPGTHTEIARFSDVHFKPDLGVFTFDYKKSKRDLPMDGRQLEATLVGKFAFLPVTVAPFKVTLPTTDNLIDHISGIDNLVSGEHVKLRYDAPEGNSCVEEMALQIDGKTVGGNNSDAHSELSVDLGKVEPGSAMLEIEQYGLAKQYLPVSIKKRKAHIQRLVHFDLETDVTADGDNLDRIDYLQVGHDECRPSTANSTATPMTTRVFSCPAEIASNANFPAQVTVRHLEQEPASFEFPVTKIGARPHMTVDGGNTALVTVLSPKGLQWNLNADDSFVTEDSGVNVLLHAFGGYHLSRGPYMLQLKFADDPLTDQTPISVPLMSDLAHNELRTRAPISFTGVQLPSVVNPIFYRVQHQATGLIGDWQPLNRSAVFFPQFGIVSCSPDGDGLLVHGSQLELIDWASNDLKRTANTRKANAAGNSAALTRCDQGLCLGINTLASGNKLRVKLHWIDDRFFDVTFPNVPTCAAGK